ncbi:30S ribosomal protein S3ae [Candidatus Micrarchaeota archaeon]|nr:30S ribosomal protein S3ae [Candidatus Micrarchaeota archaeon]
MAKPKTTDTWKLKSWYTVHAPEMFDNREIAQIVSGDESNVLNRRIQVSLSELTNDITQAYTSLEFRVKEIKGKSAYTQLIGHELSSSYLQTLIRRRRDIINVIVDVKTKDNNAVRVKAVVFTARKVSDKIKTLIRNEAKEEILAKAAEMDLTKLAQEIIFKKFPTRIFGRVKKLAPIKRVEIRKMEVKNTPA